jgi:hypothetical protein
MQSTTNSKGAPMKTKLNTTATRLVVALAVTVPVVLTTSSDVLAGHMGWSDQRLKYDIETLDGALAKLRTITVA